MANWLFNLHTTDHAHDDEIDNFAWITNLEAEFKHVEQSQHNFDETERLFNKVTKDFVSRAIEFKRYYAPLPEAKIVYGADHSNFNEARDKRVAFEESLHALFQECVALRSRAKDLQQNKNDVTKELKAMIRRLLLESRKMQRYYLTIRGTTDKNGETVDYVD